MLQEGRVRHDGEVRAIQLEAHVDLLGYPGQQLRQGLIDGVQGHCAGDARVDIDVNFGITGEGEEKVANRNVVDDDAIGFCLAGGARLG